jgi:hypothetical protein
MLLARFITRILRTFLQIGIQSCWYGSFQINPAERTSNHNNLLLTGIVHGRYQSVVQQHPNRRHKGLQYSSHVTLSLKQGSYWRYENIKPVARTFVVILQFSTRNGLIFERNTVWTPTWTPLSSHFRFFLIPTRKIREYCLRIGHDCFHQ